MDDSLAEAITLYSTRTRKEYEELMRSFTKEQLITILTNLLIAYINDKNSSTLRELITVSVAGYEHSNRKIGFDGHKYVGEKRIACEAKPKNVNSSDIEDMRQGRRKNIRKLNGGGNFTDYTWERLGRDCKENPNMLVSGFIDGKLIYILEFPFTEESFVAKLKKQLERRFPGGDDISGQFLRSASFDYNDFMNGEYLQLLYYNQQMAEEYKGHIVGKFYEKLSALPENRR